jgi:hypothetical protein
MGFVSPRRAAVWSLGTLAVLILAVLTFDAIRDALIAPLDCARLLPAPEGSMAERGTNRGHVASSNGSFGLMVWGIDSAASNAYPARGPGSAASVTAARPLT